MKTFVNVNRSSVVNVTLLLALQLPGNLSWESGHSQEFDTTTEMSTSSKDRVGTYRDFALASSISFVTLFYQAYP